MEVTVDITAYHKGWFEFRLAVPSDGGADGASPITQDMLNEHVLEIDESTVDFDLVTNYAGVHGSVKCATTGGHSDPTSTTPNTKWPHGSCCNGGGACSPPAANKDRYVIETSSTTGELGAPTGLYTVVLKVPPGIECERCTLQWCVAEAPRPR